MATKSTAVNAFFLAVLLSIQAFGQANPLIGSWRSSGETGSDGYRITYTYLSPDGTYENRMDVAGTKGGPGAGTTIIRGEYRMTSSNTYLFRELSEVMCPVGVSCYPAQQLPPDFGKPKQVHFDM